MFFCVPKLFFVSLSVFQVSAFCPGCFLDSKSHWSLGLPTLRCAKPHSSIVFAAKVTFLMGSLLSALIMCPSSLIFRYL